MTMPQPNIPTIDELHQNAATLLQQALVDADNGSALSATDIALVRSNTEAQAFVQAVGIYGAYRYLRDFVAKQAIPTKSADEFLDDWLQAYGIPRKEATPAGGIATGTGVAHEWLKVGATLQTDNGLEFLLRADAEVDVGGVLRLTLSCTTAGKSGNLTPGTTLTLLATEPGIDADFVVSEDGFSGGTNRETDPEAIYRLRQRLANPPRGSAPTDYERWALSVPGITRAWGIRNPSGPTSAGVIIMADNNLPYGLPTEAQRQAVYEHIRDPERGPPDELFVIIPTPKFVDVVLGIDPDQPDTRKAIELELKDLFYRDAVPSGRIPLSHLSEAISTAPGEYNHQMFEPEPISGGFLFAGLYELLMLRSTVFQPMTIG
ncbi:baseplate J/gp47 family protein [Collimonas sp. NPDC087041]|uniref:baseplate J/gp47 family protein n=1 Tax=Collimonas sp. NPDC087041 TaxID=3363960 RepID=UPI00380821E1